MQWLLLAVRKTRPTASHELWSVFVHRVANLWEMTSKIGTLHIGWRSLCDQVYYLAFA